MSRQRGKPSLFRAAGIVGGFTLLSRIFGFVRDMIIANFFGTHAAADAFFVAFRIPNLLRRLTAEGALSAAFVPIFAKTLLQDRERAFRFANNLLFTMTIGLTFIVVAGILCAPFLLKIIAVGFADDPAKFELTVALTRLLFPYLLFVSLAAIMMGVLNSLDHFASPAAAPVLFNISIILSVIFLYDSFDLPVYSLVVGVLAGGVLQLAIQIPFAARRGFRLAPFINLKSELLKKVMMLSVPAALGFAVAEVNMFVDTILASLLKEGSVSYLYYGNRVILFPLGVFGIAMSTALLPRLSFEAGENNTAKMVGTFSQSMRGTMFLIIPSTIGLFVLREPIIKVLFERGEFDSTATANTAIALAYYCLGLLAFSGVKMAVSAFYALGDTKTPVKAASWAMVVNIVLNLLLMGPLEHGGLALATSLASFFNLAILLYLLRKMWGGIDGKNIAVSFARFTLASVGMAVFILLLERAVDPFTVTGLTLSIIAGGGVYFLLCGLAGIEEMKLLTSVVKGKITGRTGFDET